MNLQVTGHHSPQFKYSYTRTAQTTTQLHMSRKETRVQGGWALLQCQLELYSFAHAHWVCILLSAVVRPRRNSSLLSRYLQLPEAKPNLQSLGCPVDNIDQPSWRYSRSLVQLDRARKAPHNPWPGFSLNTGRIVNARLQRLPGPSPFAHLPDRRPFWLLLSVGNHEGSRTTIFP